MPGPNQKSVTLSERTYNLAKKKAGKKPVAKFVSECIEEKAKEP